MKILPNNVAVIEGDTHHAVWCATEGLVHDQWMADHLRNLIRKYKVTEAVDAGAHIGTLCRVMLDKGVKVHAFEPNPAAVECLRHNCPEAIIHEYGLYEKEDERRFVKMDNAGASRFTVHDTMAIGGKLPVVPLDQLNLSPQLIKMDIEGFEVHALRGARKTIERCRPVMVLEVNDGALRDAYSSREELLSLLSELGYVYTILQPNCKWGDPQYDILATSL